MVSISFDEEVLTLDIKIDDIKKRKKTVIYGDDEYIYDIDDKNNVLNVEIILSPAIQKDFIEMISKTKDIWAKALDSLDKQDLTIQSLYHIGQSLLSYNQPIPTFEFTNSLWFNYFLIRSYDFLNKEERTDRTQNSDLIAVAVDGSQQSFGRINTNSSVERRGTRSIWITENT